MNAVQLLDRQGRVRKGKKVVITRNFDSNLDKMWQLLQNVSTLVEICKPMAKFTPHKSEMPHNWSTGKNYIFNFYFHSLLPIGKHTIMIEKMDEQTHEIQSKEYNILVPVWNHLIKIELIDDKTIKYTDEINLYAGALTRFVAWWSSVFYKHRQKRWEVILKTKKN